jgi:radical SAM family uncharacterized protein
LEVLRPARYIGREWNSVHKEWKKGFVKFALCFPDIYEIGMSHLGMKILYGLLNREKDVLCERIFAPWSDKEHDLRSKREEILSLEGQRRLSEFDIIGFSLQYEMNFVDVLNILDLGGVPLRSDERDSRHPIIIAGGPCAFNPEPMSLFIDAFVVGEAEEAVLEIVNILKSLDLKAKGSRTVALKEMAKIEGVYVPLFGLGVKALRIKKRVIKDLDNAYFPTEPVVPYIQIVHDRISLEIMRGCPHGCRFCQACRIFHPPRIRSVERILEIAAQSIMNTGYEEISLLSLSSGDYPYIEELVSRLDERFRGLGVKISLPSLRVEGLSNNGASRIVKKAGLTFAPEAGTDQLRSLLNKKMKNEDIIKKSNLFLNSGWRKVKLYFMIGLPGETYEDIDAIIELAVQIKNVSLSIAPFIPKPHSEFENEGMDNLERLKDKKIYLRTNKKIKMDFHNPETSRIEAVLSRGDRKIGDVIYMAWHKGARLQAWGEYFDYNLWKECFQASGVDPEAYLKKRDRKDLLPWNFIEA